MFRKPVLGIIALLAVVAVALGFFWPFEHKTQTLRLPGVVEIQEVRLGSKTGGRVARTAVAEGDLVQPGQELVVFEEPQLEAERLQLQGALKAAEADADKARNGPRPEEIQEAKADVASAEADLDLGRKNLIRIERLYRTGASSHEEYDAAFATVTRSQGRLGVAKAKLDLLRAGTRKEDIASAEARVVEARGKLQEIEANLLEAIVRAPELAVVDVLAVRKGDVVPPNQPVVRVLRADDIWVKVYVPETELGKLGLGQKAQITIDSYPGEVFEGTVFFIESESEFTPRNIQSVDERRHQVFGVKVRVPQPADPQKRVLKSGMSAEVVLPLQEAH